LGRHRKDFDRRILAETGGDSIDWADFRFDSSDSGFDVELKGLEFLSGSPEVQRAWTEFWPQGRGIQNWDAVGQLRTNGTTEWLLVEAKAHLGEIHSNCQARTGPGKEKIKAAFVEVKRELGASADADWICTYYQAANRIASLYFLQKHLIPARLLFVYFHGDTSGGGRDCPVSPEGWHDALESMDRHLALPVGHSLAPRIHKLFVPVRRTS